METPALFIIDNVRQTREDLVQLFLEQGMKAQSFTSAERFLHEANTQQIGCLILENRLPGIDGVTLQQRLNQTQSPLCLIFHSETISAAAVVKAMKLGAIDILFKPIIKESLLETVQKAIILSSQKAMNIDVQRCVQTLTKKENIILHEILQGFTNQQIASTLCISLRTVEVHRANIMKKFNAQNAVILAMKLAKINYKP